MWRYILLSLILSSPTFDLHAQKYWVSSVPGAWSDPANWSLTSGGAGGATVPTSADQVFFDGAAGKNGQCILDTAPTVNGITLSGYTGSIDLKSFTFTTTGTNYFQTGNLVSSTGSGSLALNVGGNGITRFAGSFFDVNIVGASDGVLFGDPVAANGSTFNKPVAISKTGTVDDFGFGQNVFNSTVSLTMAATSGNLRLGCNNPDTFNGDLSLTSGIPGNPTTGNISMARSSTGTAFNGNISITYNDGLGAIYFGFSGGTSTLANGKAISIAGYGSQGCGSLTLNGITQVGATSQSIALAGNTAAVFTLGTCIFNGDVNFISPSLLLSGVTCNGSAYFEKNGPNLDIGSGGNQLNGTCTIVNSGTGSLRTNGANIFNGITYVTNNGVNDITLEGTTGSTYNNVFFTTNSTGLILAANKGTTSFKGDLTINMNSVNSIQFGAGGGISSFSGASNQSINRVGAQIPIFGRVTVNKSSSSNQVILNTSITLSSIATFTRGIISSTSSNYLNFANGASASGASDNSHVDGPVRKTGNSAFTFPTGNGGHYRGLGISAPGNPTTNQFEAQYFFHSQTSGTTLQAGITSISSCEYWTLNRTAGTANVMATLPWVSADCSQYTISAVSDMQVTYWDGTKWLNLASTGSGLSSSGSTTTNATVPGYGNFTLASKNSSTVLPIVLERFQVNTTSNGSVLAKWTTASEVNCDHFTLERSSDGTIFEGISEIPAHGTTSALHHYSFEDTSPESGVNYYRLTQTDYNGMASHSEVKRIITELRFSAYPTVVIGQYVFLTKRSDIMLYDIHGNVLLYQANATKIDVSQLSPGMFIIKTTNGEFSRIVKM